MTCQYGIIDRYNNIAIKDNENIDYSKDWKLNYPDQTLKYHIGICYDTVALTKYILDTYYKNTQYKIYFSCSYRNFMDSNYNDSTHTFLIYKDEDNLWKWIEGSWQNYKNNNIFYANYSDLVNYIGIKLSNQSQLDQLIFQIKQFPNYGSNMDQFQHLILQNDITKYIKYDLSIANIQNDFVYHGDRNNWNILKGQFVNKWNQQENAIFVSPFKGIASCFTVDTKFILKQLEQQLNGRLQSLNFGYSLWNSNYENLTKIHNKIEILMNIPYFETIKGNCTGYLYKIDMKDYYNKYHKFNKNKNSDVEFCIEGNVNYIDKIKLNVEYTVKPSFDQIERHGYATLIKNYERPYSLQQIKEKYSDNVYQKLKNDEVHSWRATTGIELIHKEPDLKQQTRIFYNWMNMSEQMKQNSDKKSIEMFGISNLEHNQLIMKQWSSIAKNK